jgi:prophage maintenance system killer protein
MAVTRFLEMNGYEMIWDEGERYRFILEVAERLRGYVREV